MGRLTKLARCCWALSMRKNCIDYYRRHGVNEMFIIDYNAQCKATDLFYAFIFKYGLTDKWKRFAKTNENANPTHLMLQLARPKQRKKRTTKQA